MPMVVQELCRHILKLLQLLLRMQPLNALKGKTGDRLKNLVHPMCHMDLQNWAYVYAR